MFDIRDIWFLRFLFLIVAIIISKFACWELGGIIVFGLLLMAIYSASWRREAFITIALLLLGSDYYQWYQQGIPRELPVYQKITVSGVVQNLPKQETEKCSFVLENKQQKNWLKNIQVFCDFNPKIQKGDHIIVTADFAPPSSPGNPGEFDYQAYLANHNIYYLASIKEPEDLIIVSPAHGYQGWLNKWRADGISIIYSLLPANEAGILIGMLLGSTEGIDEGEYDSYQKTGIIHVFSVSGFHVAFVLMMVSCLASICRFSIRTRLLILGVVLFIYGSLIAWPIPVIRSVIMGLLPLIAIYTGRKQQMLNGLGLAGIIIIILNPKCVFQISFQLSFMGTWGLVYLYPHIRKLDLVKEWNLSIQDLILIPLCAQIAVLPLIAYYFNIISPVSIISNLLLSYIVGVIVILGFIGFLLAPLLLLPSEIIYTFSGFLIKLMQFINYLLFNIPGGYFWVATPSIIAICLYYIGLMLWSSGFSKQPTWASPLKEKGGIVGISLMGIFILSVIWPAQWINRQHTEIAFVDVGQGDCTLIKSPQGKFILIDGGGSRVSDVGKRKILPYLRYRGINEIYMIINTHPDVDHLQGLETVAREMKVDMAVIPLGLRDHLNYAEFKKILSTQGVKMFHASDGDYINIEPGWGFNIAAAYNDEGAADTNRQSLMIGVEHGNFSVMLCGDIDTQSLNELSSNHNFKEYTIVKVPHHGSRFSYSLEFYEELSPKYAIISVGKNNLYGHPHDEVIKGLKTQEIMILRTDTMGNIRFISDGKKLDLEVFRKGTQPHEQR